MKSFGDFVISAVMIVVIVVGFYGWAAAVDETPVVVPDARVVVGYETLGVEFEWRNVTGATRVNGIGFGEFEVPVYQAPFTADIYIPWDRNDITVNHPVTGLPVSLAELKEELVK